MIRAEDFKRNLKRATKETIKSVKSQEDVQEKPVKRKDIIKRIEDIILDVVTSVKNDKPLKLVVKNTHDWDNCVFTDILVLKPDNEVTTCEIRFDAERSCKKYAIIIHLLSKVYEMLVRRLTTTRRELYYEDVELMGSQEKVDEAFKIICCLLNTPPWQLGVFGTSKGLVAGSLVLQTKSGDSIDCSMPGGVAISQDVLSLTPVSKARFILVVEKDATFQKLLDEKILEHLHPIIMITGKGFPDLNTRLLVRLLWKMLKIPVFLIVDADPHGIEIMCVYRFGSLGMSQQAKMLAVPAIYWIGVHPTDIKKLHLKTIPFTKTDQDKLTSLSSRLYTLANEKLLKEINYLNQLKQKAEIEAVSNIARNYLTDVYIQLKISRNELI